MLHPSAKRVCARSELTWLCLGLWLSVLAAQVACAAPPDGTPAKRKPRLEDKLRFLSKGSSSSEAQEQGLAELPWDKLTPANREKAAAVLKSLSLFRELPTLALEVEPEVHQFFIDHPEVAVSIWRAMKISKFEMAEQQPGVYTATDNNGTSGQIEVLYRDAHHVLAICDGVVHSPLLPGDIRARTLLHLQVDFVKTKDDLVWSRNRLRMYVEFPSEAVETAAQVVAPLGNLIIDKNLKEVCLFVGMMSAAMTHQPGWVEHITKQLEDVPLERKEELIQLTAKVFVAERKRELAKRQSMENVTVEDIIRPLTKAKEPGDTKP
jgi:hypothetical protein